MKTRIFSAGLAFALALGALAPSTTSAHERSSGYYSTRVVGYDHCGRPIYQKVWVPTYSPRPYPSFNSGQQHGGSNGGYIHAPGIDIHFGGSSSGHHHHGR